MTVALGAIQSLYKWKIEIEYELKVSYIEKFGVLGFGDGDAAEGRHEGVFVGGSALEGHSGPEEVLAEGAESGAKTDGSVFKFVE
jgi:hypothetical protein